MATPKTVAFYTLGCKLNYAETSSIGRLFEKEGYSVSGFEEGADIYVVNTCSVTEFADKKCRKIVRKILRRNQQALIVITGCYAQLKPEEIANIPGVDLVLGAAEKFRVTEFISSLEKTGDKGLVQAGEVKAVNEFVDAFSFGDRTRSFLKIQDGCDYKCSFCTIPQARGKSRSDSVESVIANAKSIAQTGVKEIVLTGVNIGDFGRGQTKETSFLALIKELDQVEGIHRFRISSIEPNLCSDDVIDFVAQSKRFAPHFHIPLQSGNNKQLKIMQRRYKRELYANRVEKIKAVMPHACIGVDVIVGFPGETDEDFLETYRFINELDVAYLHVFTYSERPNTPAILMDEVVPIPKRKERNKMLTILSEKKKRAFYQDHLGERHTVLFEKHKNPKKMTGFTDNYIKIEAPVEEALLNEVVEVNLVDFAEDGTLRIEALFREKVR